jgi:hypothetical protein
MELFYMFARLIGRGAVMITILGLFLFFGLTGLVLWHFNETIWQDDDIGDLSDPRSREVGVEEPKPCSGLCSPSDEPA